MVLSLKVAEVQVLGLEMGGPQGGAGAQGGARGVPL